MHFIGRAKTKEARKKLGWGAETLHLNSLQGILWSLQFVRSLNRERAQNLIFKQHPDNIGTIVRFVLEISALISDTMKLFTFAAVCILFLQVSPYPEFKKFKNKQFFFHCFRTSDL